MATELSRALRPGRSLHPHIDLGRYPNSAPMTFTLKSGLWRPRRNTPVVSQSQTGGKRNDLAAVIKSVRGIAYGQVLK